MFRSTLLPAAALLGLTVLTPTSATAAGETCQVQPATIVGSPQSSRLVGTEGPDVIVTNGSAKVSALGGDDVICVTDRGAQVSAGDGDDVVDASTLTGDGAEVELGAGRDRFTGSASYDVVLTGERQKGTFDQVDADVDVVDSGPASPSGSVDSVTSGQSGVPNGDVVRMGRGTLSWAGTPTAGSVADGGSDSDSQLTYKPSRSDSVALDNVAGTLTVDEHPALSFSGFSEFFVFAAKAPAHFSFRGSDRDEELTLEFWKRMRPHSVRMGGGDDRLHVYSYEGVRSATSYAGGSGRDKLELTLPDEAKVDLHLSRGRLSTGRDRSKVTIPARGFEDSTVMAKHITMTGTAGPNELSVYACRATVQGGAGPDRLTTFDVVMDELLDCWPSVRLLGGRGHDVLLGSRGPDHLFGGRGRDRADGSWGRDVCSAERRTKCEIRR